MKPIQRGCDMGGIVSSEKRYMRSLVLDVQRVYSLGPGQCSLFVRHAIIDREPIRGDLYLRLFKVNGTTAYLVMQVIFDFVFFMEARFGAGKLRPKIRDVVGATQLQ